MLLFSIPKVTESATSRFGGDFRPSFKRKKSDNMVVCIWNYPVKSLELRLATDVDSKGIDSGGDCKDRLLLIGYRGQHQIVVVGAIAVTGDMYDCV